MRIDKDKIDPIERMQEKGTNYAQKPPENVIFWEVDKETGALKYIKLTPLGMDRLAKKQPCPVSEILREIRLNPFNGKDMAVTYFEEFTAEDREIIDACKKDAQHRANDKESDVHKILTQLKEKQGSKRGLISPDKAIGELNKALQAAEDASKQKS